ncbi:MAG: DUF4412 domain-containing protein [Candidatus Obscuribacterales bacterium]|nr:DUF4412 domain-containing protein [Candidatus Obscuribacterales bacterium]
MRKRSSRVTLAVAALALANSAGAANYPSKAYEATIENVSSGSSSHTWSDGKGKMRSETMLAGVKRVSILDFNAKMMYSIDDQQKSITKMPLSEPVDQDPQTQWQEIGSKVVEGHPCTGKRGKSKDGSLTEVWTGTDTGCSVLVSSNGKTIMKLKSWSAIQPNPSLFSLPAGYKTIDMGEMMKKMQAGNFDPQAMQKLYQK